MVNIVDSFVHGLEKPLIVWLLSNRPRHGYELMKELRKFTGQKLKPATVYPFLQWLEDEGFAVSERVKRHGRKLKCYRLTKKGEDLLTKLRDLFNKPIKELITDLLGE